MLINIIHKGLQFMEIETHMNEDGELMECNAPFSLLKQHQCDLTGKVYESADEAQGTHTSNPSTKRQRKEEKKAQKEREKRARKDLDEAGTGTGTGTGTGAGTSASAEAGSANSTATLSTLSLLPTSTAPMSTHASHPSATAHPMPTHASLQSLNGHTIKEEAETSTIEPTQSKPHTEGTNPHTVIDQKDVIVLEGHQNEVFSCSWNPVLPNLLASGSGDATARFWQVPDEGPVPEPIVLNHLPNLNDNKDVTTLDWDPSGTFLATGSYDGQARIWTQKGQLRLVMSQHRGPIFSLKWNRKGDLVLSGSADTTTIVWDPETGDIKHQFSMHTLAILDVDWMDNTTFASCSSDKTIYVCRVGSSTALKKWVGHEDEVNAVRWDPTGQYLASCSDDMTTKIWSLASDQPVQVIKGHRLQIYTLQWAPYTPSKDESAPRILATASFDATVRLWDALTGSCLHVLKNHSEAVYSISFSPDARLLATGSFDEVLNVWYAKDGTLQKTFKANGGIFEVHFNKNGDKLAACTSNKQLVILDMKS
ncbi:WD40-repeat-containing domain protein [Spinellus fusiger]|nr:WD40-repeat-containing domain protein [Spinellus fusiger]